WVFTVAKTPSEVIRTNIWHVIMIGMEQLSTG
ncbi:unnamed protein product, partial [marine sediment metagenome]